MGQPPTENPFGDCPICGWTGGTPHSVIAIVAGVQKPIDFPEFPGINGIYTLGPCGNCFWCFEDACKAAGWSVGVASSFGIQIDPTCEFPKREIAFVDNTGSGCKLNFVNQLAGNPNLTYTGGTAVIWPSLPTAAAEWIASYGMLPPGNWKYENTGADDSLEQIYLGSRKYKANCRILFDPAQIIEP